jgi:UDP-3-O-[3-hydroxymyristoyl] glucosamine N-acyltransferase
LQLREIAGRLGLSVEGDASIEIRGLAGLEDAGPDELSFVTGPRYRAAFEGSRAGAFVLPPGFEALGRNCLRSRAPYADFARAIDVLLPARAAPVVGVHASAVVAPDAEIGPGASIGAFVVVGPRARIGARSVIHPHVTLYADVRIGADCVVHSGAHLREGTVLGDRVLVENGAVVGADGFGHAIDADGRRVLIPHRSPVEVGDDAEIGANSAIDASHPGQPRRGHAHTRTWIGRGAKIDNLVMVGHGCSVGDATTLSGQVGLAGGTVLGRAVMAGGQAGFAGHLEVGAGAVVGAQAGVISDVEPGEAVLGYPQVPRRHFARIVVVWKRLPELWSRLRRVERRLGIGGDDLDGG